jgi:prepilin-type N-terminal cleavage/methylation domain-containing protein
MSGWRKVSNMFAFMRCTKRTCGSASGPCRVAGAGFTLLEMLVSIAVLSVIMGGVVTAISTAEQTYARTGTKTDMYENVRGVAELMTQEIGQAGLVSIPASTTSAAIVTNAVAQAVTVSSTTSMYVGEVVTVDAGPLEEPVTLTAVSATQISGIFAKSHPVAGAPITALGSFLDGVVHTTAAHGSTPTTLNLFGDINGDGTLVYVRYVCNVGTPAAPGTLTRSVTTITPGVNTIAASQTLLNTVIGPAGGCFQYVQPIEPNTGLTFVTSVGFTVSVQATVPDPQTGQYATMTKSFLNLSPRNVAAGYEQAAAKVTTRLQQAPPNVSLY